jgi:hypothetical protein
MVAASLGDPAPFVTQVRGIAVAKLDSIGFVVQMYCQCLAGKEKKAVSASHSFLRHSVALRYLALNSSRNFVFSFSASPLVSALIMSSKLT